MTQFYKGRQHSRGRRNRENHPDGNRAAAEGERKPPHLRTDSFRVPATGEGNLFPLRRIFSKFFIKRQNREDPLDSSDPFQPRG